MKIHIHSWSMSTWYESKSAAERFRLPGFWFRTCALKKTIHQHLTNSHTFCFLVFKPFFFLRFRNCWWGHLWKTFVSQRNLFDSQRDSFDSPCFLTLASGALTQLPALERPMALWDMKPGKNTPTSRNGVEGEEKTTGTVKMPGFFQMEDVVFCLR